MLWHESMSVDKLTSADHTPSLLTNSHDIQLPTFESFREIYTHCISTDQFSALAQLVGLYM